MHRFFLIEVPVQFKAERVAISALTKIAKLENVNKEIHKFEAIVNSNVLNIISFLNS